MTKNKPYNNFATCITVLLLQGILLGSCGQSTNKNEEEQQKEAARPVVEELHLNMPKGENEETTRPLTASTLSLILLEDKWYSYNGGDIKSGVYCDKDQFRALLLENKKTWRDSLFLMIKPTDKSTYAAAVDALDEMAINKIERYALVALNPGEESYFGVSSFHEMLTGKREDVKVKVSDARTTAVSSRHDGSFLIRMGANDEIFVKINDGKSNDFYKIVDKTKAEGLSLAIAAYRQDYPTGEILISGANNAKYEQFQFIVDLLKARDELKYSLVTEN